MGYYVRALPNGIKSQLPCDLSAPVRCPSPTRGEITGSAAG
jgi:hypothetical protein